MFLVKDAAQGLLLEVSDVANAYLYSRLRTPIIMQLPSNSTGVPIKPDSVALVHGSLYGHRAAGHIWGSLINDTFINWSFAQYSIDA